MFIKLAGLAAMTKDGVEQVQWRSISHWIFWMCRVIIHGIIRSWTLSLNSSISWVHKILWYYFFWVIYYWDDALIFQVTSIILCHDQVVPFSHFNIKLILPLILSHDQVVTPFQCWNRSSVNAIGSSHTSEGLFNFEIIK